jgi:hypothetical protein
MLEYNSVTMPPKVPKTMRNRQVRRSHISIPNVRMSRKSSGNFALYIAVLPAAIPTPTSCEEKEISANRVARENKMYESCRSHTFVRYAIEISLGFAFNAVL